MTKFTKTESFFQELYWCLKARETDKNKPVFTGVYVDEENIVCSDSRRLHLISNHNVGLVSGLYEVIKYTKSEIVLGDQIEGRFPPYKAVLKDIKEKNEIKLSCGSHDDLLSKNICLLSRAGVCLNVEYVRDATCYPAEKGTAFVNGPKDPVLFKIDNMYSKHHHYFFYQI